MTNTEKQAILQVHRLAFGDDEGPVIEQLADNFLARPDTISISVSRDDTIAGNVLFTPFAFQDHMDANCQLLAPLGVLPEYHGKGVGRELMETAIAHLKSIGTDAVYVLGVPTFYPRFGFVPTDKQTPYPNLLTIPESWMELALNQSVAERLSGRTVAIEPFMQPELWDTSAYG